MGRLGPPHLKDNMSKFRNEDEINRRRTEIIEKMIAGARLKLFGLSWNGEQYNRYGLTEAARYAQNAYNAAIGMAEDLLGVMSLDAAPVEDSLPGHIARLEAEADMLESRAAENRRMVAGLRALLAKR